MPSLQEHYGALSLQLPEIMTLLDVCERHQVGDQLTFFFNDEDMTEFQATLKAIGPTADQTELMLTVETERVMPLGIRRGVYTFRVTNTGFPWEGELNAVPPEMFEPGEVALTPAE